MADEKAVKSAPFTLDQSVTEFSKYKDAVAKTASEQAAGIQAAITALATDSIGRGCYALFCFAAAAGRDVEKWKKLGIMDSDGAYVVSKQGVMKSLTKMEGDDVRNVVMVADRAAGTWAKAHNYTMPSSERGRKSSPKLPMRSLKLVYDREIEGVPAIDRVTGDAKVNEKDGTPVLRKSAVQTLPLVAGSDNLILQRPGRPTVTVAAPWDPGVMLSIAGILGIEGYAALRAAVKEVAAQAARAAVPTVKDVGQPAAALAAEIKANARKRVKAGARKSA